jgi:hypothetical protein
MVYGDRAFTVHIGLLTAVTSRAVRCLKTKERISYVAFLSLFIVLVI